MQELSREMASSENRITPDRALFDAAGAEKEVVSTEHAHDDCSAYLGAGQVSDRPGRNAAESIWTSVATID